MTGVLLVDKPVGMTSAGVVRLIKRLVGKRTKVGHVGTLDPFASGLLPVCVGEATKVARYLSDDSKRYEGVVTLGAGTDTLDPTGVVVEEAPVPHFEDEALAGIAETLSGTIEQQPPMYSAVKRDGIPLYRLARRGESVERQARVVRIETLRLRRETPITVHLDVECSKGTYVRVLAADIARALGTVGHLSQLRRTRVGRLSIGGAEPVDSLVDPDRTAPMPLLSIRDALVGLRQEVVSDDELERLQHGQQEPLGRMEPAPPGTVAVLLRGGAQGEACGVAETDEAGRWRLARLIFSGDQPLLG